MAICWCAKNGFKQIRLNLLEFRPVLTRMILCKDRMLCTSTHIAVSERTWLTKVQFKLLRCEEAHLFNTVLSSRIFTV